MRIAVFLDDIHITQIREDVKYAFLFEVDQKLIKAIGKELVKVDDINYICLWLLGRRVKAVYYDHFSGQEKSLLGKINISVEPTDKIRGNPVLQAMLVNS